MRRTLLKKLAKVNEVTLWTKVDSLFSGIHEIEFTHMVLDDLWDDGVLEELVYCLCDFWREIDLGSAVCLWIVVEDLLDEELGGGMSSGEGGARREIPCLLFRGTRRRFCACR